MKVTVYSTEACAYCALLKNWLDGRNIEYVNYSVDQNPFAAQMMIALSGQMGVPFSTIEHEDGRVDKILGFNVEKFEAGITAP
jgi:glutaredoxin